MVLKIAAYTRISVDMEKDRDNTSIENQKRIISSYVEHNFPDAEVDFFVDRDKSGYTFEQREDYQRMRPYLLSGYYKILVIKDFSRFSRRNSRGLVELEDLRDAGVRIISIGDGIDYPTYDDWNNIQVRFLLNEMPVTDTSKKIRRVIKTKQADGDWICNVPYGYYFLDTKRGIFAVNEQHAAVVREIFRMYTEGAGYKKIAKYLNSKNIPTPSAAIREQKEAKNESMGIQEEVRMQASSEWAPVTVQRIITNDFYIGTLRTHKWARKNIHGIDTRVPEEEQNVFENHHSAIIDEETFVKAQKQLEVRTNTNYRGLKKYESFYAGIIYCGDCGNAMFYLSHPSHRGCYVCGRYHRLGRSACTGHRVKVELLDTLVKKYVERVMVNSENMIHELEKALQTGSNKIVQSDQTIRIMEENIEKAKEEFKALKKQKIKDLLKVDDDNREIVEESYLELENEYAAKIRGLENQLDLMNKQNASITESRRLTKTVLQVFDDILKKDKLDKSDLSFILEKITVYDGDEAHIDIQLKPDIQALLETGCFTQNKDSVLEMTPSAPAPDEYLNTTIEQVNHKHKNKTYNINVVREGEGFVTTLSLIERYCYAIVLLSSRIPDYIQQ